MNYIQKERTIIKESKKAFTLIEVLISVTILALTGAVLIQIASNNKQNFQTLLNKIEFDEIISIPLTHRNKIYHKTTKDLYTYLYKDYNLTNDDIIRYLKSKKVSYEQKNFSVIKPFESNESEDIIEEENQNNEQSFTINVDKIVIFNKENSFTAFTVNLQ